MDDLEEGEDEMSSQDVREVDKDHILNYQSDSSDGSDGEESSLDAKMEKQKQALRMNDTWGKTKKSYYKNKEDSNEDESSDEDQAIEAERLQRIRREKLARQFAATKEMDQSDASEESKSDPSDSDSDDSDQQGKKLGDALFASDDERRMEEAKQLNLLDKKVVKSIIESDSPEMIGLL